MTSLECCRIKCIVTLLKQCFLTWEREREGERQREREGRAKRIWVLCHLATKHIRQFCTCCCCCCCFLCCCCCCYCGWCYFNFDSYKHRQLKFGSIHKLHFYFCCNCVKVATRMPLFNIFTFLPTFPPPPYKNYLFIVLFTLVCPTVKKYWVFLL